MRKDVAKIFMFLHILCCRPRVDMVVGGGGGDWGGCSYRLFQSISCNNTRSGSFLKLVQPLVLNNHHKHFFSPELFVYGTLYPQLVMVVLWLALSQYYGIISLQFSTHILITSAVPVPNAKLSSGHPFISVERDCRCYRSWAKSLSLVLQSKFVIT